jgi:hypothetical protein
MKAHVWDEIIEPALMDVNGDALFIGTPKGKNHFYKIFMGALEKPIDENTGDNEKWADYEAFNFKTDDNPFLSEKAVAAKRKNSSRNTVRQEMDANFLSAANSDLKSSNFPIIPFAQVPPLDSGSIFITVDLAGFKKQEGTKKIIKTDESVICVTFVSRDYWYVLDMLHGHWDVRKTAQYIANATRKYPGSRLGIEKGALMNAVGPYLDEYMREFNLYVTPEPLTHGNARKVDRIVWALQGRSERRQISFVKGDWNDWMADQIDDFPDPLAHDDGPDALAYTDQMARANYVVESDIEEWQELDPVAGF